MSGVFEAPGKRRGWCVHFLDMSRNARCKAGVDNHKMKHPKPCYINDNAPAMAPRDKCREFLAPTAKQVAAREAWRGDYLDRFTKISPDVIAWRTKHKGKNYAESIPCAACGGVLSLSINANNGHVHGRCGTPGCVSWIE